MKKDVVPLNKPEELINWLKEYDKGLMLSEDEAKLLLGYFEGHDYQMAVSGDKMFRIDLQESEGEKELVDYPIEDVVDIVCEWNYEMLQCADLERNTVIDVQESVEKELYYQTLQADEVVLDKIFDRTRYGMELNNLAQKLAKEAIHHLKEGVLEQATTTITQGMAQLQGKVR